MQGREEFARFRCGKFAEVSSVKKVTCGYCFAVTDAVLAVSCESGNEITDLVFVMYTPRCWRGRNGLF
jgi:hypothetical protein